MGGGRLGIASCQPDSKVGDLSWKLPQARVGCVTDVSVALVLLSDCVCVRVCVYL